MGNLLYIIGAVLVALWIIGLLTHIGGSLIHLLLLIAVIVFLVKLLAPKSGPPL